MGRHLNSLGCDTFIEQKERVERAFKSGSTERLTQQERNALKLRYEQGKTYEQIAQWLGLKTFNGARDMTIKALGKLPA